MKTRIQQYVQSTLKSIKLLSGCNSITYHKDVDGLYGLHVTKYGKVFIVPLGVDTPVLSGLQTEALITQLSNLTEEDVKRIALDEKAGRE